MVHHIKSHWPGQINNREMLMKEHEGVFCLIGTVDNHDEKLDNYIDPREKYYDISEELFDFLKGLYGVDHIIR